MKSRPFLPLVSLSALALAAALLGASVSSARADTVASNTDGPFLTPISFYVGQSFTTTTATAVNNIAFNFFSDVPATTPYALGTGFLLSSVYTGTPAGLSSATPGFLGQADAAGGVYTFDSSLTLAPGTQYFFYVNALIPAGARSGGNVYAGGVAFFTTSADVNFSPNPNGNSGNFRVTGSPVAASFSATGSLATARYSHTATLLSNGKVLVAGGSNYSKGSFGPIASAELYDPATGSWSATGSLATARVGHTATLLPNGKVLVAGGRTSLFTLDGPLASAELYDPATGSWSATGSLATARSGHTATLLPNGKVLVVGSYITSAELYDPATGRWRATGSLATARDGHTATLLANGNVLVAGGGDGSGFDYITSAELYDPATGRWSATGSLSTARAGHTATLLPNGKVLVVGGRESFTAAELYDPATGSWSTTGFPATARASETATLLPNGNVLIAGGYNLTTGILASAELYEFGGDIPTTLGNISTRGRVETGDNVMIGGFIVTGTQPKKVIVRAIGPSLSGSNVPGALADPTLTLHGSNGVQLAANDDWQTDQEAEINATTLPPDNPRESAIVRTLQPGPYTAIVRGKNGTTGVGLVEAFDLDRSVDSKLANISTRGLVQTGDNVLIAGTIVVGQSAQKVIIRAIGPSLPVTGKLADPTLDLFNSNGVKFASNNNWRETQEAEIIASTVPPTNDLESALVATLPPGGSTAIVRGNGDTTGVALVEVYALD